MNFNTRMKTAWIIIVVACALIGWDVYARMVPGATISEVMLSWSMSHPIVPFLFGVLFGHLFWYQEVPIDKARNP